MKKLDLVQMENLQGQGGWGAFLGGLSCGVGLAGLSNPVTFVGGVALVAGCASYFL